MPDFQPDGGVAHVFARAFAVAGLLSGAGTAQNISMALCNFGNSDIVVR